ncbi:hypothetical protein [uncultured Croceitalea sp.]|uniref:hypothetical protein n=1 Tax=uncultured Croceitalea sp. TaxID=1798908 RepID=UPI0033057AEA
MKGTVLYRKGSHITDISIQSKGRICIMSGGVGGEFVLYIPTASEPALFNALCSTSERLRNRLLGKKGSKKEIFDRMVAKFSSKERDPEDAIRAFLAKHEIPYTSEYWPNR